MIVYCFISPSSESRAGAESRAPQRQRAQPEVDCFQKRGQIDAFLFENCSKMRDFFPFFVFSEPESIAATFARTCFTPGAAP
jgi:hypothetical protein